MPSRRAPPDSDLRADNPRPRAAMTIASSTAPQAVARWPIHGFQGDHGRGLRRGKIAGSLASTAIVEEGPRAMGHDEIHLRSGGIPASRRALRTASPAASPSGAGAVTRYPSKSFRIRRSPPDRAPRLRARSRSSRRKKPPPPRRQTRRAGLIEGRLASPGLPRPGTGRRPSCRRGAPGLRRESPPPARAHPDSRPGCGGKPRQWPKSEARRRWPRSGFPRGDPPFGR